MFPSGRRPAWQTLRKLALVATVFAVSFAPVAAVARQFGTSATVALGVLPFEAQTVYRLVRQGGPFPYPKDGVVFGNRERLLPSQQRGFYREYTVRTPGSADRGARRIVCGGKVATKPETCYYTRDHYQSFQRIVP